MYLIMQWLLVVIFLILSMWHFYWVAGGKVGMKNAVPEMEPGKRLFTPSRIGTAVVACGLLMLALLVLERMGIFGYLISQEVIQYACRGFAVLFALRAIGEFKYIGFFAKNRPTSFSKWDKRVFSPLCVLIALLLWQ